MLFHTSMKTTTSLLIGMTLLSSVMVGCSQEVAHSETDKPHLLDNGRTHEETTTFKNPDGTTTTEHQKSSSNP